MMQTQKLEYDPTARFDVDEFDVEYRQDSAEPLLVRIYRPRGTGPFPALLEVHGGAWNLGTRELDAMLNRTLAASGVVVAAIDFRLAPAHPYPASMVDLNYATRWLKAHAADFGASPDRLGALGTSSGGHMVVLSAMRPRHQQYAVLPLPEAPNLDASLAYVVACWPVLDPYARYLYAREAGRDELVQRTEAYFRDVETMQDANPSLILARGEPADRPPVLIVHGTADTNVPRPIIDGFFSAYRAAGGVSELALFPDARHHFTGPETDRAIAVIKDFIARQLATKETD